MAKSFLKTIYLVTLWALLLSCQQVERVSSLVELEDQFITIYSSLPSDQIDVYLADFVEKHPDVQVDLVFDTAASLTQMLISAEPNQRPDVIWGLPVSNALQLEWLNLLKPYEPVGLEQIEPRFRDSNQPPHWVGTAARVLVLCVNTEKSAELNLSIPQSWQDLLSPDYRGQIAVPASTVSGSGFLVIGTLLDLYGEPDGWQYLAALHEQTGIYAADVRVSCQLAAEGRVPIAISFDYRTVQRQEAGDPIELIYPAEGAGWDMEVTGLVRKDKINDSAKQFVDWAISESAFELYGENRELLSNSYVPLLNVDDSFSADYDSVVNAFLLDEDLPWISANRERILRQWSEFYADQITIVSE